jgi:hypothetical protein
MLPHEATLAEQGHAALASGRWSDAAQALAAALELEEDPDTAFGLAVARWWLAETDQGPAARIAADRRASDDFASVIAGTLTVEAFFDPANLGTYGSAVAG